jgi:hypothetical protein
MTGQPRTPHPVPPLRLRPLTLKPGLVDFDRRGFPITPEQTRTTLEAAAGAFLHGFNATLASPPGAALDLDALPPQRRGFAAEGAAMAAAMLDLLNPAGGRRLAVLHDAHARRYAYLLHVGEGWALAKLRRARLGRLGAGAPLLRWLAYDGMGFCQGFFAGARGLRRWAAHPGRCPASCGIRHQGFGRSLWFRGCGDPATVAEHIAALPPIHHGDAWSGVALAATYAGGVGVPELERLHDVAAAHSGALAQGSAFAAEAWRLSGHVPEHAEAAVGILAATTVAEAAAWTWQARQGLDEPGAGAPHYQQWRQRTQRLAVASPRS